MCLQEMCICCLTLQEALQLREERGALLQRLLVLLQQLQAVRHHHHSSCKRQGAGKQALAHAVILVNIRVCKVVAPTAEKVCHS